MKFTDTFILTVIEYLEDTVDLPLLRFVWIYLDNGGSILISCFLTQDRWTPLAFITVRCVLRRTLSGLDVC